MEWRDDDEAERNNKETVTAKARPSPCVFIHLLLLASLATDFLRRVLYTCSTCGGGGVFSPFLVRLVAALPSSSGSLGAHPASKATPANARPAPPHHCMDKGSSKTTWPATPARTNPTEVLMTVASKEPDWCRLWT